MERDFSRRVLLVRFVESNDLSKQLQTKGGTPTVLPEDRVFQVLAGKVGEPEKRLLVPMGVDDSDRKVEVYTVYIHHFHIYIYIHICTVQVQIHIKGYLENILDPKVSVTLPDSLPPNGVPFLLEVIPFRMPTFLSFN